jgi:hypothetical protein
MGQQTGNGRCDENPTGQAKNRRAAIFWKEPLRMFSAWVWRMWDRELIFSEVRSHAVLLQCVFSE